LSIAGSGSAPSLNQGSPGLGTDDDSVKGNAAKYYTGTTGCFEVGTKDLVIEVIGKLADESLCLISKYVGGSDRIELFSNAGANAIQLLINGVTIQAANVTDEWNHMICFVDRSGSAVWYVNGAAQTPVVVSSVSAASPGSGAVFTALARTGGSAQTNSTIAYMAEWDKAAWLDTHLQATVAAERFQKFCGIYPSLAKGTASPTTATRAFDAMLDKYESGVRKLYRVGDGWMRRVRRYDNNGMTVEGVLIEQQSENEALYSEDFTNAAWVKTRATIDSTNGDTAPDRTGIFHGIIAAASTNTHSVGQAFASSAGKHYFSVFAKAGNKNWLYLDVPTVANADCYFNLSTGVVGTAGAGAVGRVEDWGGGVYRCMIEYTGGVPSHSHDIYPADADNDHTFLGDGSTVNVWVWGAQHDHEIATDDPGYMTSYIPTTTAARTRLADELVYKGDDGNVDTGGELTITCNIMPDLYTAVEDQYYLSVNDGGATTDAISMYVDSAGQDANCSVAEAVGAAGAVAVAGTIPDGNSYRWSVRLKTNDLQMTYAGTDSSTDTSVAVPDDLDRITIGSTADGAKHGNAVVSDLRIHKAITRKP